MKSQKTASHNTKRQGLTLRRALLISTCTVVGVGLLGPYQWHIYSIEGLAYYYLIILMLFLGLSSGNIFLSKRMVIQENKRVREKFSLTDKQLLFLTTCSLISIICCICLVVGFLNYYGTSYLFLGGAYFDYSFEGRGLFEKICTVVMQAGIASYLIYACNSYKGSNIERIILFLGFCTTALYYLLTGARFSAAVTFLLFCVVIYMNSRVKEKSSSERKKLSTSTKILIVAAGIILLYFFLTLFQTRGIYYTALNAFEYNSYDKTVREPYISLYNSTNGAVSPFYFLCDYIGEAPYVFSYVFDNLMPDTVYFLQNSLRSVVKLLGAVGIVFNPDAVSSLAVLQGKIGKFSGFAWPLLLDVGVYFAPFVAYCLGLVFVKVERALDYRPFCRVIYPCIFVIVLFSPIYYLTVGRIDYVLLWIFMLWPLTKLFGNSARHSLQKGDVEKDLNQIRPRLNNKSI